jgi:hypothetical protein
VSELPDSSKPEVLSECFPDRSNKTFVLSWACSHIIFRARTCKPTSKTDSFNSELSRINAKKERKKDSCSIQQRKLLRVLPNCVALVAVFELRL